MHPELRRLAAIQGGAFRGTQARKFHRSTDLSAWLDDETVTRDSRRIFRLAAQEHLVGRLQRAELHVGRPVIACSATAATLHGFGVISDERVHVTTANGWSKVVPDWIVLHQAPPRGPVGTVEGIMVTHPADTAVDVAASVRPIDVLAVLDAAFRSTGLRTCELNEAIVRARGRRGLVRVKEWAPFADPRAESPMESRTRFRLIDAGLPAPEPQVAVTVPSGGIRYIDMGWRKYRLGVDYEGEEFHTGTGAMSRDRRRHNNLTDSRWQLFYPTAPDIYRDHRDFTGMVRRAFDAAARLRPS